MDQALADIGIISAYRFAADGAATKLDVTNLDAELANPHGWLWLHFNLANRRCHDWLARTTALSDVARETLLDADEHIRLDIFDEEIAGVLPTCIRSSWRRAMISCGCTLRSRRS
jgi:zinc transporter